MATPTKVRSTSRKHTARMTKVELAKVVAEHFGFTVRGNWVRDDRHRTISCGWEHLADKLAERRFIVEGVGVDWRRIGERLVLPVVTRDAQGYWK